MTPLTAAALRHLRELAEWPDLSGTRYDLVACIGRGGMGTVFRVHDRDLGRDVALKVSLLDGPEDVDRVRREARTLASLEHPGIVPVHEAGVLPDGRAYYVMRLVRGDRLDRHLEAMPDLYDRLRLFDRICDTVAFAHAQGIVHRDLKPSNVMIGAYGEVLVLDWGLAGRAGAASPSGGTDGYMAPEQRDGAADARSDVHALGAILRDLLSGCTASPRQARPLGSIAARAMAVNPRDRYGAVTELAADVRRFVDGRAVEAHREGPIERAGRLARAYRVPIALVAAYLLVRVALLLWSR